MKTKYGTWVGLAAALIAGCGGGGGTAESDGSTTAAGPARRLGAQASADMVVQLRPGTSLEGLLAGQGLTLVDRFGSRPIFRLRAPAGADAEFVLAMLRQHPGVRFAELNARNDAPESRRNTAWTIGGDAGVFSAQWAPQALRLSAAHASAVGTGVRVAVLDTGADLTHPALAGQWARDSSARVLGRDFVDDDADPSEAGGVADAGFGHGTHVAGLVALAAPGARILPVRVLDAQGVGNAWVLAEAIAWALDPDGDAITDDGAHVINLSLGSTAKTELLKLVTDLATCEFDDDDDDIRDSGFDADRARCAAGKAAVVLAAAGNSGLDTEMLYPAAEGVKGTLSVAASTALRRMAPFSNFGSWINIAAPGELVISAVPGGGYGTWSGTSMASPLAAGVAALVLSTPAKDGDPVRSALRQWRPEDVSKRLTDRSAYLCGTSLRQVDAAAAVLDVQAPDVACP